VAERFQADGQTIDEGELAERFTPAIERVHRRDLLLQNVARQEGLEVTEEEVETEIEGMAQEAGVEPEVLRRKMETEEELPRLRDTLQERKVLDFLVANAKVNRMRRARPQAQDAAPASRIIIP
jgi:trigger factor